MSIIDPNVEEGEQQQQQARSGDKEAPPSSQVAATDEPVREEGRTDGHDEEYGYSGDAPAAEVPYEPKAPERSPAPAVFKAWRQANYGTMMMQAVLKDDADMLIWMLEHNLVDLAATDDLGNTAAHLAVFHDSPRVLRLLHELGLDLSATCDAEEFGSAIFYAVYLGRVECLQELIALGYDMAPPCDRFGRTPEIVAERHDQGAALVLVHRSLAALDIQRLFRGLLARQKAKRIKAAWARGETKKEEVEAVNDVVLEGGGGGDSGDGGGGDNLFESSGGVGGVGDGWDGAGAAKIVDNETNDGEYDADVVLE